MNPIPLILFEDPGYRRFGPLTALRPVWDLLIGLETIADRIARRIDCQPSAWIPRDALLDLVRERHGANAATLPDHGDVLLVNGRAAGDIPTVELFDDQPRRLWTNGPDVVAVRLPAAVARLWLKLPKLNPADFSTRTLLALWSQETGAPELDIRELKNSLVWWPWDLLQRQGEIIQNSLRRVGGGAINGEVHHAAILVEENNIHIAAGANVAAGAILDGGEGAVILMDGVRVMPGAIIIGPVAIGPDCVVKPGAKLQGPLSLGPACRVGGELANSILIGHANKQHDGFLGHSLLAEWVNLGAGTNTSNLKNNYSDVSVVIQGEKIGSGGPYFGSIIGDHVKTAINSRLNTGTVIGVGSNLFDADFPPKTIGAFRWGGSDRFEIHDFDKFIATAKIVMARRDQSLSPAMINLLRNLHSQAVNGAE